MSRYPKSLPERVNEKAQEMGIHVAKMVLEIQMCCCFGSGGRGLWGYACELAYESPDPISHGRSIGAATPGKKKVVERV
jgi:hypothetical protein